MKIIVFVLIIFVLSQDFPTQKPIRENPQATFQSTSEPSKIVHTKLNDEIKEKAQDIKEAVTSIPKKAKSSFMNQMRMMEKFFKTNFWPFKDKSFTPSMIEELEEYMTSWEPRAEMFETKDKIKLKVELPGITKSDLKVELKTTPDNQRDILHIHGVKKKEHISNNEKHYYKEIFYGDFCRSWTFGKSRITGVPNAKLENGILTVEMNKRDIEEQKPVVLEIPVKE